MKEYNQYCPVALGSEVLAERWVPLIVRELVLGGRRFNEIDRGLPGISRSLLKQRLDHLERKGVVDFLGKYVRPEKVDGCFLCELTGKEPVWNWRPGRL